MGFKYPRISDGIIEMLGNGTTGISGHRHLVCMGLSIVGMSNRLNSQYNHLLYIGYNQGRPQDLAGGGAKNFFFQIWKFACREATCCAWRSHALC